MSRYSLTYGPTGIAQVVDNYNEDVIVFSSIDANLARGELTKLLWEEHNNHGTNLVYEIKTLQELLRFAKEEAATVYCTVDLCTKDEDYLVPIALKDLKHALTKLPGLRVLVKYTYQPHKTLAHCGKKLVELNLEPAS